MRAWGEFIQSRLPDGTVFFDLPLREKTTLRIGGTAPVVVEVHHRDDLVQVVQQAVREGFPWFLLGGGSNVLFSDRGFPGLVIVNRLQELERGSRQEILCGAGVSLMNFVRFAEDAGLSGAEDLAGIPGSLGGAIVGNAGAFGRNIAEILDYVELITETGEVVRVSPDSLEFDYRESRLKESRDVVLSACLKLAEGEARGIAQRIDEILSLRAEKHPPRGVATAGSFFKNLPPPAPGERRIATGWVLDQAGARGLSVGDAAVFEKHANIVVNRGNASAADVLALTAKMKQLAYEHAGVRIEEEVRRIGFTPRELGLAAAVEAGAGG